MTPAEAYALAVRMDRVAVRLQALKAAAAPRVRR
jgi:hypothetical protein